MKKLSVIHIGTSGWYYNHWIGPFYPAGTAKKDLLAYYIRNFSTVEINNTFYRLPKPETFMLWRKSVPDNFVFSVKASRFITHIKRLNDPQESLVRFLKAVEYLGDTLGPILFQLPPRFTCNIDRLTFFLKCLPGHYRYTFEFRNPGWFNAEVYTLLKQHNCAFCIYDLNGSLSPLVVTADFVYIRLHGPAGPYQGKYSQTQLQEWSEKFTSWKAQKKDIFCYFDNDQFGYAAQNAVQLSKIVPQTAHYTFI